MLAAMNAADWVRRFPDAKVVVLGDLVADEYVYGETERVSREAPVLIVRHEYSETKPGGAANAAANVASMRGQARTVGIVGRDAAGRALATQLARVGADTKGLVAFRDRCTETKTRILAGGRSTTRQQMLRVDRAEERPLRASQRARLREALHAACEGADAVMVSDYGSGLFDDPLIGDLQELAKRLPVCVDSRYRIAAFRGMTVSKPNEPELQAAIGGRLRTPDDVERAGRALLDKLDSKALVVTRGRLGMSLFERKRPTLHIPVWGPDEAVDVTGAGDTVLAALSLALGVGAPFADAARLANIAGGIVVQKPGTATCSSTELLTAIELEPPPVRVAAPRRRKT